MWMLKPCMLTAKNKTTHCRIRKVRAGRPAHWNKEKRILTLQACTHIAVVKSTRQLAALAVFSCSGNVFKDFCVKFKLVPWTYFYKLSFRPPSSDIGLAPISASSKAVGKSKGSGARQPWLGFHSNQFPPVHPGKLLNHTAPPFPHL